MAIKIEDFPQALQHLKTIFAAGVHTIVFTKTNGDERTLKGTRDPNVIGLDEFDKQMNPPPKKDGTARAVSNTSIALYDIEAKGWRSCKLDKIISLNGIAINNILPTNEG